MSESSAITAEQLRYLARHTLPEDDFLRSLKAEAVKAGLPPIWIAPEQGSLMHTIPLGDGLWVAIKF